jgi:hypothetical protein
MSEKGEAAGIEPARRFGRAPGGGGDPSVEGFDGVCPKRGMRDARSLGFLRQRSSWTSGYQ